MSVTTNKEMEFNDLKMRLIGIPITGLFVLTVFIGIPISFSKRFFIGFLFAVTYTTIYWHACRAVFFIVHRRFSDYRQVGQRIFWQVILIVLAVVTVSFLISIFETYALGHEYGTPYFYITVGSLVSAAIVCSIYESIFFFNAWRKSMLDQEALKRANVQSQLETLKSQVNPHFLFNSLNTLASIIPDDPDVAVDFVQNLSKVYRHILEFREQSTITLAEEIEAVKAYIFLLKIRFSDNLNVNIDIPTSFQTKEVIPLSLQMLLENAVKHNIVSTKKPLHIDIFIEKDQLIVRNNLQRKRQTLPSTKFGLENIKKRYQLLTQQIVEVIVTTQYFVVSLPLIN